MHGSSDDPAATEAVDPDNLKKNDSNSMSPWSLVSALLVVHVNYCLIFRLGMQKRSFSVVVGKLLREPDVQP